MLANTGLVVVVVVATVVEVVPMAIDGVVVLVLAMTGLVVAIVADTVVAVVSKTADVVVVPVFEGSLSSTQRLSTHHAEP